MNKIDESDQEFLYQHHWLVCGEVFTQGRGETTLHGTKLNALILTKTQVLTKDDLDKAQKLLIQRMVMERPIRKNHRIVDSFLSNIVHLGLMNSVEFNGSLGAAQESQDAENQQVH